MKTQHFTSQGYMVIKNEIGQYSFKGSGQYDLLNHMKERHEAIERMKREMAALQAVLDHESECSPQALTH